ncbi:vomeronasal type-2 receptor 26-like [Leptodactylus fuscus]|uniref:vomeronasal type-2 receptor 26-like n=1 Tax=Leptodactylus fuscus TaxID=238119 RepID=UPI003F4F1246
MYPNHRSRRGGLGGNQGHTQRPEPGTTQEGDLKEDFEGTLDVMGSPGEGLALFLLLSDVLYFSNAANFTEFNSTVSCALNRTRIDSYAREGDVVLGAVVTVSYGAQDLDLSDKTTYPSFLRTVPNESNQYDGIIQLLRRFGWTWLNKYLRSINFNTTNGENFYFNNGETPGKYDIVNWFLTPNKTIQTIQVGKYDRSAPVGRQLVINESLIKWNIKFKEVPRSVCSNSCLPGYRKVLRKSQQKCCYDCIMCSEGEITNGTDMMNCIKCLEMEWSNEKRDKCISRSIDYLSYEDPLGISLCYIAIQLSLLTLGVLGIFLKHKDTPIVKANNRDLSYILLLSLTLSFLCALLFIGRPQPLTCIFQQAAFGITFTIAISSVLAKTVTVLVAFNSIKPGSKSRRWMSSRVSMYLVCFCSFGEIIICLVGFLYSPPFPQFDTQERSLKMTLNCNQGSANTFYVAIGYMTFLALISFIIAFLARKLPDNFNEASHITFSMLVFCSVWVSFFPAYISTKGKYMTAVEIFAMLASSTGVLACIFLPKCYVIIIRPDLNTKQSLMGKNEKFASYGIEAK